jgi:hypothetical protein
VLCGALPCCGASACVSMLITSVAILESDGAHDPYCTNDCLYSHAIRRKQKLKLRKYDPQREFSRMRANLHDTKNAWSESALREISQIDHKNCISK